MQRVLFYSFLLSLFIPGVLFAQRDSSRTDFLDAESWFLFEEYADALPLYMRLHRWDPGNDNLNYKIGICLLNDPYQKDRSIEYLLKASDNINPYYKENSFKERTAPPDALYYLGNAYLVNELLDLAIESYERFLEIMDRDVYDEELVQTQIRACKNAQRLKTMPVDIDLHLLDSLVNTRYSDIHPVVSGDGTKLAFVTELPFYDGAFYCEKTDDGWSYPQSITTALGYDADIYPVSLSHDGTEMILYYDDQYIGNLYYSQFEDGRWLPAVKLDENISTKYWESHACFSRDGRTLYFTSNRKGTHGGLDIYKSDLQADGKWGPPENLGPTINSRYNEETPFITGDGQTLYFSSYGHYNMGGYDIFFSKKDADGSWGEPINLGYPINTTDDDIFFQPVNNGFGAYYSIYSNRGRGRHDIYYMDIYSVDNPRIYFVSGNLLTEDGFMDTAQIAIFVVDSGTGDTIMFDSPVKETGAFSFNLQQGLYELHFTGPGYEELIRPLSITSVSNKQGIRLDSDLELSLVRKEPLVFIGEESRIQMKDTLYEGVAGETIEVPLKLEKGSILIMKVYQDSLLVSVDTIEVDKRRTTLEIEPLPGTSRVELEMVDKEGNIHKSGFTVTGHKPRKKATTAEETEATAATEEAKVTTAAEGAEATAEQQQREKSEVESGEAAAMLLLLNQLQHNTEGALNQLLDSLDTEAEGIATRGGLFEYLYSLSDSLDYSKDEIDLLLADAVAHEDARLLYRHLLENSDGPLRSYLENLDLDQEGIHTPEELVRHLEQAANDHGFTMDDVRTAMLRSLDQPLEVDRIHDELLEKSGDPGDRKGWPIAVAGLAGAGCLLLIILWWRRRKNRGNSTQ